MYIFVTRRWYVIVYLMVNKYKSLLMAATNKNTMVSILVSKSALVSGYHTGLESGYPPVRWCCPRVFRDSIK